MTQTFESGDKQTITLLNETSDFQAPTGGFLFPESDTEKTMIITEEGYFPPELPLAYSATAHPPEALELFSAPDISASLAQKALTGSLEITSSNPNVLSHNVTPQDLNVFIPIIHLEKEHVTGPITDTRRALEIVDKMPEGRERDFARRELATSLITNGEFSDAKKVAVQLRDSDGIAAVSILADIEQAARQKGVDPTILTHMHDELRDTADQVLEPILKAAHDGNELLVDKVNLVLLQHIAEAIHDKELQDAVQASRKEIGAFTKLARQKFGASVMDRHVA
jgi:hypothetical protein